MHIYTGFTTRLKRIHNIFNFKTMYKRIYIIINFILIKRPPGQRRDGKSFWFDREMPVLLTWKWEKCRSVWLSNTHVYLKGFTPSQIKYNLKKKNKLATNLLTSLNIFDIWSLKQRIWVWRLKIHNLNCFLLSDSLAFILWRSIGIYFIIFTAKYIW